MLNKGGKSGHPCPIHDIRGKGNHKQNERITLRWVKIFANEVIDKGLISKIYKQIMYLNIKKKEKTKNGQKI